MTEPRHIVGLSGGGDSTAMALLLADTEPRDYTYICNATGNELPDLFRHLAHLETLLGKPVHRVGYKTDLYGLIDEQRMLPNFRARFCTRMLKIEPTIEYFETLPRGSVLYVGLLADEEERAGLYGEDIAMRFPLRELGWRKSDVFAYNRLRGVDVPKRTDCAVCPYQRIQQWFELWRDHPAEYAKGEAVEAKYGKTFRSEGRDTWPASLAEMRQEFDRGRKVRPYVKKNETEICRVCSL
jgi:3'-phosphoadenosine 5'-phosphosulfate sulfotransferase (PAPS reductase)/FAD synthetase